MIVDEPSFALKQLESVELVAVTEDERKKCGYSYDPARLTAMLSVGVLIIVSIFGMDYLQGVSEMAIYKIGV
jgi:hypothetical protein